MNSFDPDLTAKELDDLTFKFWHGDLIARHEYQELYRLANLNGFKVIRKQHGKVQHKLVASRRSMQTDINGVQFLGRSKTSLASMLIYEGRPTNFKCPKGCCTTRAMSYVMKDKFKFEDIYAKQMKIGLRHAWNRTSTIKKIMAKYGDFSCIDVTQILSCKHNRSAASIAARLFSIKSPMAFETTNHMAAIDNSHEVPCIVDKWDSRNSRVELLYVKRQDANRALAILDKF